MNCSNAVFTIASGVAPSCATTGGFTQIVLPADTIGPFKSLTIECKKQINRHFEDTYRTVLWPAGNLLKGGYGHERQSAMPLLRHRL